jgi:hypothetical protein
MVSSKVSQTSSQPGNDLFQVKSLTGQGGDSQANSNLSAWIAENFTKTQKETRRRFDTFKLEFSALRELDDASLEELSDDLLKMFLNEFRLSAAVSAKEGSELVEFRDQLTALDETIAQYRTTPDDMGEDDENKQLDAVRSARETFLQKGVEVLNKYSSKDIVKENSYTACALDHVIGSDWRNGLDDGWTIDVNAEDIHGEIDQVLSKTRSVTQSFNSGVSKVAAELERRGYSNSDPYADYFARQKTAAPNGEGDATRRAFELRELYNAIWADQGENLESAGTESVSL